MARTNVSIGLIALPLLHFAGGAWAQSASQPAPTNAPGSAGVEDRGWPRRFEGPDGVVTVYQPQVDSWPGFDRITFRAAVAVEPKGTTAEPVLGVLRVSADTTVAFEERLVVLSERKIESLTFPDVDEKAAAGLREIVMSAAPPSTPQTISLDRLIASMDPGTVEVRKATISVAPPKIVASRSPAVMVMFMGAPRFKPVPGKSSDLMFAINTNWDVFLDSASGNYYLLHEHSWFTTRDLEKGPWSPASALPAALSTLPADENWADVRAAIPGSPPASTPTILTSREPTELVVTLGEPELEPIAGTTLMLVTNTESDLLYNGADKRYYLLAAGRWFKASSLEGPWSAASESLPEEFRKIPEHSAAADLRASVPGTPEAAEAMVLASIPQKATITRSDVTVEVTYDGTPDFRPIETTAVKYAHNTPFNVFLVDGKYYCCHNAVWFISPTPQGAWSVCDAVPKALYTIPANHAKHHVTYVYVYESTPTTVVTGYTGGYSGQTVAATGVVMFGLGVLVGAAIDHDDCCWSYHWHSCYFSYGCGAVWRPECGGFIRAGHVYGPYGGAGCWARYNPGTGAFVRGGYVYGPHGAGGYRAAYNPATGIAAGRAGGVTPFGSWGRAAITNGDEWVRAGYRSGPRGEVRGVQGSGGAGAVHVEGRWGNGVTVAKGRDGDVYVGKDGNIYRRGNDGWQQARNRPQAAKADPANGPATTSVNPPREAGDLQREAAGRDRGDRSAARAQRAKSGTAAPARGGRRPKG